MLDYIITVEINDGCSQRCQFTIDSESKTTHKHKNRRLQHRLCLG
jgi:hypothetical protein